MAWVFFKERMLNYDPAFFSFLMIQEDSFSPVLGRYGTILSQLLPYALLKSGADLETILRYYSLSFVLLYILYLIIIGVGFKDRKGIIALCIALTFTFRETFFYSTAELYQGIGLSVVLWSLFSMTLDQSGVKRMVGLFFSLLLVIGISFFHQLGIFTVFFVLSVEFLRRKQWRDYQALGLIVLSVVWYIIRIKILTTSDYEQERLLTVSSFIENLFRIHHLESFKYFAVFFKNHLIFPFIASIAALLVLVYQKRWLMAAYIPLFVLGFWLVIIIGMSQERSPIMLQNYYTIFGLFSGVLFAIVLSNRSVLVQAMVVILLGLYSLMNIYQSRYDYKLRTEFVQLISEYGQQFPEKKYVMHAQHLPWEFVWINWALPFETMMSSEINPDQESVTFFSTFELDTLDAFDIERPDAFLGAAFEPHWFSSNSLNSDYFHAETGPYRIVTTPQTEAMMRDSILNNPLLNINPFQDTIRKSEGFTSLRVQLKNDGDQMLASLLPEDEKEGGVYLYFKIFGSDNQLRDLERRRILFDLPPDAFYTNIISYYHPPGSGNRMELGYFSSLDSSYFSKATILLD